MSAESKKQFISDHKEQVKDANLLIGYLDTIQGIEKKRAEIEKEIAKTVKDEYEARIKGIKEVEEYQQKLTDQAKQDQTFHPNKIVQDHHKEPSYHHPDGLQLTLPLLQ